MILIKDLPIELQQLAHKRQMEQGNTGLFNGDLQASSKIDNFNWSNTPEGSDFWYAIHNGKNMKKHPKYPKTETYELY